MQASLPSRTRNSGCFYLAGYLCYELPVARINVTRFQRASEGANHSTGGCCDYVVDRRGV